jgi:hypothetical protein
MGLLMNGIVKIPMQFFILLIGVLVFSFYQFNKAPAFFNEYELDRLKGSPYKTELAVVENKLGNIDRQKQVLLKEYAATKSLDVFDEMRVLQKSTDSARNEIKALVKKNNGSDNDTNYIFLHFVVDYLPAGLVGLIIAVIFLASWGSIAAALNSLASSTMVDFHKRFLKRGEGSEDDYKYSRLYSLLWGVFCIAVAMFVSNWGNSLIEVVNILGSLFYGTILGIFLVAFYAKRVKGKAVFIAAVIAELLVILLFFLNEYKVIRLGFLWLNGIGALAVWMLAVIIQFFQGGYRVKSSVPN